MDVDAWTIWCNTVVNRLTNLEKSLKSYHKLQKRMLYLMFIGFVTVIVNGVLLYYK